MDIYIGSIEVGDYEIMAVAETPAKCRNAIIAEYRKAFGTFKENGFGSKSEWLEYHSIADDDDFQVMKLNSALCL